MHDQAVRELGIAIVSGRFPAGIALPVEAELGEWLSVSRTVVREATKVLADKGLLRSRPRVGTLPLERSSWDVLDPVVLGWMLEHGPRNEVIRDVSEVRLIIEPAAARLAALRRTDDEAARLVDVMSAMERSAHDEDQYVATDLEFHALVLGAAHNATLVRLAGALSSVLSASRRLTVHGPGGPEGAMGEHRAVADAIVDADADGAEEAMRALIVLTRSHIEYVLDLER